MLKRKNILIPLVSFLILSAFLLSGCSSKKANFRDRQGIRPTAGEGRWGIANESRRLNLTEEERQKMISERQQLAIEACQEKNEGDSCQIETPREEMSGVCNIIEENLVCTTDRPMGQRRE